MKEDQFEKNVFKKFKEVILEINDHYDDCKYHGRSIPIDECACDCYQKQIFNLGRKAEKDLFYSSDPRR